MFTGTFVQVPGNGEKAMPLPCLSADWPIYLNSGVTDFLKELILLEHMTSDLTVAGPTSTTLVHDKVALHSSILKSPQPRSDNLTAVILHGAGESSSQRHEEMAQVFAGQGISVVTLDFIGHGKTGGSLSDGSLTLRTGHAKAAIEHWTDANTPLIICGFSMGGHTVLSLLPHFGKHVKSIGLFCPATYAAEAEEVHFGSEFTKILRTNDSWRSSLGIRNAEQFKGRAAVVIGSEDTVIPWEVVTEITKALKTNAREVRLEILGGASHQLAVWLAGHKTFSKQIVQYLAGD